MKKYLIPGSNNNFTPLLLHRSALVIYVLVVFVFNIVVGQLDFSTAYAAVDASTLYSLHNTNRTNNSLAPLQVNQQLVTSATNKARAMLESNCWDHYCPPGTSPWTFILNTGYEYIYAGENLGEGFTNSNTLMNAWMNSPSHRANVLNGNFTEIGIGFAYGSFQGNPNNTIAVVHFGSKGSPSTPKPSVEVTTKTVPRPVSTRPPATRPPAPTGVPPIQIDSPGDGSILNTADPEISGIKPEISNLEFYINEQKIGEYGDHGENFSFRPGKLDDGENRLKVVGFINNEQASESPEVRFTIDTVAPKIDGDSLEISYSQRDGQSMITVNVEIEEDDVKLLSNLEGEEFTKTTGNRWTATFSRSSLQDMGVFSVTAEDLAGNQSILEIPASEILGTDHTLFLNQEDEISQTNISGALLGSMFGEGVRTRVNVIFILFLLMLFSLDFYFLNKSGLTGLKKSKSHLQISAIVILFMVMLVGGFTGSIL